MGADGGDAHVGFDLTSIESGLRVLAHFRHWLRRHSQHYVLIESRADVLEAKRSGRLGVSFDLEGACALGDQISMIELY